jgi:hypothetical protein
MDAARLRVRVDKASLCHAAVWAAHSRWGHIRGPPKRLSFTPAFLPAGPHLTSRHIAITVGRQKLGGFAQSAGSARSAQGWTMRRDDGGWQMRRPVAALQTVVDYPVVEPKAQSARFVVPSRTLALAALLSLLLAAAVLRGLTAEHASVAPAGDGLGFGHTGLAGMPLAALGASSAQPGAAGPAYRVSASGGVLEAVNRAQRLQFRFERSGVALSSGSLRLQMRLRAVGWGTSLRPLGEATPRANGNRVSYAHAGLSEWYVNGLQGLEQGFTIRRAPTGHRTQALTLSIGLSGDAHVSLASGAQALTIARPGSAALHYRGLVATDGRGRTLHSWLELHAGTLLLRVDTRGASYPMRIDPLIAPGEKFTAPSGAFPGLFGARIALSADGNTAVIGAPGANGFAGGAWVFTRSGSTWSQQGGKLVGSEEVGGEAGEVCVPEAGEEAGECRFARSVSISADGNTVLIGSPRDNKEAGAAWVFTRSGSTWTQQGKKLTGGGEEPTGRFGKSVALSGDGNTALIGGSMDGRGKGSAWAFTRSEESTWSQQGPKLTGLSEEGESHFGGSVALSADGNTALIGGPADSAYTGAVWPFARSGSTWAQRDPKLVGGEETGAGHFGFSVALSGDGNTALIGGRRDNEGVGAVWAFTRSEPFWAQQGSKLVGQQESGAGEFGYGVALSADGTTALIGGPRDNSRVGAAWELTRSGATWAPQGGKLVGGGELGNAWFGASVALTSDGSSALIGGPHDNGKVGAVWAFLGGPVQPPKVTGITPTSGASAGGTAVTIKGSGFLTGASATIGNPATSVHVVSETEITARTAATEAGAKEVVVSDENGTSTGGPTYTYLAPSVSPPVIPSTGSSGGAPVSNALPGSSNVLANMTVTLPPPKLGLTGNLAPVSGHVFVKLPGSPVFVALSTVRQVPFGTIIDATHGKVTVTTIGPNGRIQVMTFFEGEFILTQSRNGQVLATLAGGDYSVCPTARERSHLASVSSSHASRRHVVRKLWGEGHGHYSTKGSYAAGAVLGTRWLTEDRCDGTLIRVTRDRVAVTSLVNHRHVTVRAGHSYLAKAP